MLERAKARDEVSPSSQPSATRRGQLEPLLIVELV
jgi:hypothetical protein